MAYSREYRLRIMLHPEPGGHGETRAKEWRIAEGRAEIIPADLAPIGPKIIKALEELEEAAAVVTDL